MANLWEQLGSGSDRFFIGHSFDSDPVRTRGRPFFVCHFLAGGFAADGNSVDSCVGREDLIEMLLAGGLPSRSQRQFFLDSTPGRSLRRLTSGDSNGLVMETSGFWCAGADLLL